MNLDGVAGDPKSLKSPRLISPYEGPLTPVIDANGKSTRTQEDLEASFGSVLFREKLREFDEKYVTQGRFGYELDAVPSSPKPRGQHRNERIIPRVGLAHEEDLESYETSEIAPDEGSILAKCAILV